MLDCYLFLFSIFGGLPIMALIFGIICDTLEEKEIKKKTKEINLLSRKAKELENDLKYKLLEKYEIVLDIEE